MSAKVHRGKLTAKQVEMAYLLADPETEQLTVCELCKKVGIDRSTFYKYWLKNDNFVEFVDKLIDRHTDAQLGSVWRALIKKCVAGDTQAIKLFFELKGKYKQRVDVSGGVTVISGEENLED